MADGSHSSNDSQQSIDNASQASLSPFHLAVQVNDLAKAREFYGELLGCREGHSANTWVDFDFFGHQFVCHLNADKKPGGDHCNEVDGHGVPVPHFGIVLDMQRWSELADRLKSKGVEFVISPYIRFQGEPGEQGTMFFYDPSGNAVEMKGFKDLDALFAK